MNYEGLTLVYIVWFWAKKGVMGILTLMDPTILHSQSSFVGGIRPSEQVCLEQKENYSKNNCFIWESFSVADLDLLWVFLAVSRITLNFYQNRGQKSW